MKLSVHISQSHILKASFNFYDDRQLRFIESVAVSCMLGNNGFSGLNKRKANTKISWRATENNDNPQASPNRRQSHKHGTTSKVPQQKPTFELQIWKETQNSINSCVERMTRIIATQESDEICKKIQNNKYS